MTIPEGRVTCILGRNGVGKTTLLKNIMGLSYPSSGTIRLGEMDITALPPNQRARAGLGLVPQGRQIFPKLSVLENLRVGLEARPTRKKNIPEEVFDLFPVLKKMAKRMGGDLSGGQQQQLAIARALVGKPKVLLLDEPTEGIQPNIIQQIGEVLYNLVTSQRITVVLVEQYLDFVKEFGHHFYVLNRGRVVAKGETAKLPADLVHKHLSVYCIELTFVLGGRKRNRGRGADFSRSLWSPVEPPSLGPALGIRSSSSRRGHTRGSRGFTPRRSVVGWSLGTSPIWTSALGRVLRAS